MTANVVWISILAAALVVSACSTPAGTASLVAGVNVTRNNAPTLQAAEMTIAVPKHGAPTGSSVLSSLPPAMMRVLPFNDKRRDLDIEGRSTAAFGVPMGKLRFEPSPATLLGQAVVAEIRAAGHAPTDGAAGIQIAGTIVEFEAQTDTTLLYWDVNGSLAVSLQFSAARGTDPGVPMDYRTRCSARTYVWPSEAVIAGVMSQCLGDFTNMLRTDGRAAAALRHAAQGALLKSGEIRKEPAEIATPPRAGSEKLYTHPDSRWSVSYPPDWKLDDTDRFVKISKGPAILGIHSLTNVTGTSLDEVADAAIREWEQQIRKVNAVRRVSRQRVTLADDLTAIEIVHHIGAGQVGKSQKIIVIVKDRRYLIDAETYLASWPNYEGDFNWIIDSFRVLH